MRKLRRTILSTLMTPALLASMAAAAQTTTAPEAATPAPQTTTSSSDEPRTLDQVTVVGIRGSLEAAKDIKRDSTQIVDAIVADDIGKLPDTNVAESLGRVAGVQLERGMGEGSDILVRGLRENVILYNGRQIVDATGRGGNGLDQLNTSTYGLLTLVPSELISRLSVTKLAGSDQVAGALGGIIDIETRKPLAGDASQNVVTAEAGYDELGGNGGGGLFTLLSGRNSDNTFGGLLSATYSKYDVVQQGLDTFSGYARFNDTTVTPARTRFGSTDMRAQDINDDREKYGISAVLQWRPTDGVELTADTFYSKQDAERDRYWIAFNPSAALSNAVYSPHDILIKGTSAGPVLVNTEIADIDAEVWSSALRATFRGEGHLGGSAEVSYGSSSAEYHQNYMRLQPVVGLTSLVDFDLTNGDFGSFNVRGVDLTDPNQLRLSILFDNRYRAETDTTAARTDWTWDFDDSAISALNFGARYSSLDTTQNPSRADIRPAGGIPANQLGDFLEVHSNNDFMDGEFAGLPRSFLAATRSAFTGCAAFTQFPSISQNAQCLDGTNNTLAYAGTFNIAEDFTEAYAKLDLNTAVGNMQLAGNVGMRYVGRDMDSTGNLINPNGTPQPTVFSRKDDYWLPSGIVKLDINDSLVLRGGAARVVAFPNTEDLNNGVSLNNNAVFDNGVQITPGTGTGGAPGLDPFEADQYDLSLEWYYSDEGMLSAGLFYKDVSTFIVQRQSAETYGGVNFLINRKVNGDSATIQGLELLAQVPIAGGFGIVATYTYIDSKTPITDINGNEMAFPGLSKNNANLIGYYEQGPFSARLAYNWRDEYLVALSAAATGIYNDTYSDLSATVSYDLNDRLTFQLDGINLLDSQQKTFDGYEEGLRTNVVFGRGYKATVTFRF